jgi:KUP system potassium uptake protein
VIASQALISGVFSLTSQAIQLGFAPRTRVVYTSSTAKGQIYVPSINWALMIACVGLVIAFGSSARLAAAFGLSVTGTMLITSILFAIYARRTLRWNPILVAVVAGIILFIEAAYFAANAFKILDGGWFPLAIGVIIVTLFTTWQTGRRLVEHRIGSRRAPLNEYAERLDGGHVKRVDGTAVFLHSRSLVTPPSLLALVRTTGTLHNVVFVLSVKIDSSARVHPSRRVQMNILGNGIHQVTMHYGFMDKTRIADDLETHLQIRPQSTDYILGREFVTPTDRPGMARWREILYALMVRNASDVAASFHLPADRVVEIGLRVEI